jgi:hypothetical protein
MKFAGLVVERPTIGNVYGSISKATPATARTAPPNARRLTFSWKTRMLKGRISTGMVAMIVATTPAGACRSATIFSATPAKGPTMAPKVNMLIARRLQEAASMAGQRL